MSEIKDIPKHWEIKKLGEVCKILAGYGFPKNIQGSTSGEIPFYKVGDISKNVKAGFRHLKLCDNYIDEKTLLKLKATTFPKHTIVFAKIGEGLKLNRRAIITKPGIVDNNAVGLKANETVCDDMYLFNFLTTVKLEDYSKATTVPSVRKSEIEEITFPLPPLPEQQAIVAKIEELLSELENGKQQLLTAQQQLKVYRQSLLKWAFEGKEQTTVGELFDFVGGGTPSKKIPEYWQGDIPWASVKDVKGDYLKDTQDRISAAGLKDSASNLAKPKDVILITRISPGKTIITNIETAINQDLKIVKPKFETTPKFIFYVFKSIEWECVKKSSGTTVLGINLTSLKEISVPKLNLKEQQIIVDELESKLTVCDKIEETISQSLQQAETLRQSILKKAFEGKLV